MNIQDKKDCFFEFNDENLIKIDEILKNLN